LRERAKIIAAVAAALGPHPLAGRSGKRFDRLRCDGRALSFDRALSPRSVGVGLIVFSSAMRSFSIRSEKSVTPLSMAS
jgi:hypothetical protein